MSSIICRGVHILLGFSACQYLTDDKTRISMKLLFNYYDFSDIVQIVHLLV